MLILNLKQLTLKTNIYYKQTGRIKPVKRRTKAKFKKFQNTTKLEEEKYEHGVKLKFDEEKRQLNYRFEAQQVEIEKLCMEIQNLRNEKTLFSKLIQEMPDIKSLKIIQSNGDDPIMNSPTTFIEKISSFIENFELKMMTNIFLVNFVI